MNAKTIFLCLLLLERGGAAHAQQFTTQVISPNANLAFTNEIGANQVLELLSYRFDGLCYMQINNGTSFLTFGLTTLQSSLPKIPGPATMIFRGTNGTSGAGRYISFKLSDRDAGFTPSSSVVIPTDATGPVDIVLESSTDLINWTAAMPGTYGAGTTKRFFRVRATRQ